MTDLPSMAGFADMSHPERVRWLAEREKQCPGGCSKGRQPMGLCQTCNGTGTLPRFPMLRRRPTAQELRSLPHAGEARELWVPVATLEELLNAVAEQKQPITITSKVLDNSGRLWEFSARFRPAGKVAFADDLGSALSLALCWKVEGER